MALITDVPSPFCGVGTDDLSIQVDGVEIKVIQNGCSVNTPAFEQPLGDRSCKISGRVATLEEAVARSAELLVQAEQPVIGGCGSDVNGMRAILSLADRIGAVVDKMSFNAARNNLLALQDSGWMTTTLAEIKNRCDLLIVVGADLEEIAPRFFERYLWTDAMHIEDGLQRRVVYLGKAPSGNASTSPNGEKAKVLACEDAALPEVVTVLRALVKGRSIQAGNIGGIDVSELKTLAEMLLTAKYGVVIWAASTLGVNCHAELIVQTVSEMVKDINDKGTRCSGLPLAGKEGGQTANQVCSWTTGYPTRVSFARGYPVYDPYLFDSQIMVSNGEADALLWVQAYNVNAKPPVCGIPTIVVGRCGMVFDKAPDVFIPIGTPGIDHTGHAYRTDNVVAIRLKKLRDAGLPSTAEVLSAIEQATQEAQA